MGKFFPDGYGCEAGGRFDNDEPNNDEENTESKCKASNRVSSSGHPGSLEPERHEKPDMTESSVSSAIFFPDGYGCEAVGRFDNENTESECMETDSLSTRTNYFDEYGKEVGRTCESEHKCGVSDPRRGEELEVAIDNGQSGECFWDGISSTPKIDLKFKSRAEVRKFVNLYSSGCKCKMVIISGGGQETCRTRKIVFGCTYGYQRKSVATQARPGAHSKKKNCKAKLRFYCSPIENGERNSTCVLTHFNEDHNHELFIPWYKQDSEKIETYEE